MKKRLSKSSLILGSLAWALFLSPLVQAKEKDSKTAPDATANARIAVVRLVADQLDFALSAVASSTQAVANEWVLANRSTPPVTNHEYQGENWQGRYSVSGKTLLFQTWDGALSPAPAYQSENPAWYAYRGEPLGAEAFRQLEVFRILTPAVRAASRSYPYAWSYVTTASDMMLLYPFLTMEEAVNNQVPSQQVYYQQADFANRTSGWTAPYLDLVGAGLMVTVSTPAYDGDTLLGVVSHDITLHQLSKSILQRVTSDAGGIAWIVDSSGLVIAVSDSELEKELEVVNAKAKAAMLHYRDAKALAALGKDKEVISATRWINSVTEAVLAKSQANPDESVIALKQNQRSVLARRSSVTNWLFLWVWQNGDEE